MTHPFRKDRGKGRPPGGKAGQVARLEREKTQERSFAALRMTYGYGGLSGFGVGLFGYGASASRFSFTPSLRGACLNRGDRKSGGEPPHSIITF
jgi:hypothetical protein